MYREKTIKEILERLDGDCYGKGCNYLNEEEVDGMPTFYSRDFCYNISFKQLLKWYIPRLGMFDFYNDFENPTPEEKKIEVEYKDNQLNDFLDLVDIYGVYVVLSKMR